ncbi:hypothetical protein HGRIS_004866 [Hohenbuehelia grisea]|uniref:Uncharacterized protein n=1 Tax=Hohenbuehelia grisea TaxID=104357 RepID=A0ABR3JE29_9AGAR
MSVISVLMLSFSCLYLSAFVHTLFQNLRHYHWLIMACSNIFVLLRIELPPAKRRRGLAGSIVSTAVSAALIGTAVGLTVYRLWRDRGKEIEQLQAPPPPYQQGGWTPIEVTPPPPPPQKAIEAPPPRTPHNTPRARRTRQIIASSSKRSGGYRSRPRARAQLAFGPSNTSRTHGLTSLPPPEFDFGDITNSTEDPVEEQMDWLGGRLAQLIEDGKKALGREVVVMSEAKEDELDDGSDAWVEDAPVASSSKPLSRTGSLRWSKRPAALTFASSPPPSYSPPAVSTASSAPYHSSQFEPSSAPQTPSLRPMYGRGISVDADLGVGAGAGIQSSSWKDDGRAMESPEIREAMERARARFGRGRQGAT